MEINNLAAYCLIVVLSVLSGCQAVDGPFQNGPVVHVETLHGARDLGQGAFFVSECRADSDLRGDGMRVRYCANLGELVVYLMSMVAGRSELIVHCAWPKSVNGSVPIAEMTWRGGAIFAPLSADDVVGSFSFFLVKVGRENVVVEHPFVIFMLDNYTSGPWVSASAAKSFETIDDAVQFIAATGHRDGIAPSIDTSNDAAGSLDPIPGLYRAVSPEELSYARARLASLLK